MKKPKSLLKQCDTLWSTKVKERAGGKCEKCGEPKYVQAHHIVPRTNYALRHDLENGVALCRRHHLYWAHKDMLEFGIWIREIRNVEYLMVSRQERQSKNDYNAIKLYLEGV